MDHNHDQGILKSRDDDSEGNESPVKQQSSKRNSLFDGVFMNFDSTEFEDGETWGTVFDDQGPTLGETGPETSTMLHTSFPPSLSTDSSSKHQRSNQEHTESSLLGTMGSGEGDRTTKAFPLYCNEALLFAPQTTDGHRNSRSRLSRRAWHNDALDRPHRERMMQDIAQLLLARKNKGVSHEKWVARVKAQTRAFESQLYKNAGSLEDYKDIVTLKKRIASLANAFTSYFRNAKQRGGGQARNPTSNATGPAAPESLNSYHNTAYVRQTSVQSAASSSSRGSMEQTKLRGELAIPIPSSINPNPLPSNVTRAGSDYFQAGSSNLSALNHRSSDVSGSASTSIGGRNNMENLMRNNAASGLQLSQQSQANNPQQLQQQILQLQQQMALARQISIGQGSNDMMTSQGSMMGNGSEMMLLNHLQQQNPMNMNMNMIQQQILLQQQQQQQQQQQNSMSLNLLQHAEGGLMGGNNMVNMNMQNLLSGGGMQGMMNNAMINSRSSSVTSQQVPHSQGMNTGDGNSMLPGPFDWYSN